MQTQTAAKCGYRFVLMLTMALVCWQPVPHVMAEKSAEEHKSLGGYSPRGDRRVIHCSDMGSHFGFSRGRTFLFSDPTQPEELRQWIRMITAGGADTYVSEVYFDGLCMYYRSDYCQMWDHPGYARFKPMMDDGIEPLAVYVEEAQKQGIELLAGFRMNDRHRVNKAFFKEHPDWLLKDLGHGVDYSLAEVRDWMFSILEEVPARFDVDGIELNFIRHGYCFPRDKAAKQHPIMTEFLRRVRKMLDVHGEKRGRHLLLGVRVPTTLMQCRHFGFDVPMWVSQQLIDYVAPSDWHCTDVNVKYDEFAKITRGSDCFLYPAIQADVPGNATIMTLDNYRAAVQNFYGSGADGFSTHNYDAYMWGQLRTKTYSGPVEMFPKALDYFKILRDPKFVAAGDRHYLFHPVLPEEIFPKGYRGCPVPHRRAVLKRDKPSERAEYGFRICEHLPKKVELPIDKYGRYDGKYNSAGRVPGVWLVFPALGMVPGDDLVVDINGQEIPAESIRHIWYREGRPGWEGRPLPPFMECRLSLTSPPATYGDNCLGFKLLKSATGTEGKIVVDELEVIVHRIE